eukprot:CAMPEP_0202466214 /NCGR_PEP_ID=MMETSP1360-20130828/68009_1 /ASSEMBLY_ACC=CAM_ASM_000848 /TAXON_ID=515479 /ORGANISM="Licmophora paradoxa, Strain CCMP2313" /LENGTH=77 /DNA_ID=CAMNT_0049090265 /DNA_START=492 /DNA_END=721 /DNA_ORIENTATION=+
MAILRIAALLPCHPTNVDLTATVVDGGLQQENLMESQPGVDGDDSPEVVLALAVVTFEISPKLEECAFESHDIVIEI